MNGSIGLLNVSKDVEEELFIFQYSGNPDILPEEVKMAIFQSEYDLDEWGGGDWIVVVDGEVFGSPDTYHPWKVEIRDDD